MIAALSLLATALSVLASPTPEPVPTGGLEERAPWNPTTKGPYSALSAEAYSSWNADARWAAASYCGTEKLQNWGCGDECTTVPGGSTVELLHAGGDNDDVPYYYVAQNASHVIVSMRGLNGQSAESWINAIGISYVTPNKEWFPGSPGKVHDGFYGIFKDVREQVLTQVEAACEKGLKQVLVAGHSMGGAVGQLLAVYLQKQLGVTVTAKMFGPARVGNEAWANYVDATLPGRYSFMTVYNDLVPHLPPMWLDYRHPSNEVWMMHTDKPQEWRVCEGQENDNCSDSISDKGQAVITDAHGGPYAGIMMKCD